MVSLADIDDDGDLGVFFGGVALVEEDVEIGDQLLIIDGHGHITDESVARLPPQKVMTSASQFIDLNGDGAADFVLGTFKDDMWGRRHDAPWLAYANKRNGAVVDETKRIFPPTTTGNDRYIEVADFDGDDRPDLYLASRGGPDLLLINVAGRDRNHPLIAVE